MDSIRQKVRDQFLQTHGFEAANVNPLAQDASFRRYFRIADQNNSYILMDAPPEKEKILPFIAIAKHLSSLKLRAPVIYEYDVQSGFILLEDFGDNTFTRLLTADFDESKLYHQALDVLINLHLHPDSSSIDLPSYSKNKLIDEALLLCDWYFEQKTGKKVSSAIRNDYIEIWNKLILSLPSTPNTLVLRDFHVDNLILLENEECGLLDFQDAVLGSPAYDLVSLLEDARRDVSVELSDHLLRRYFEKMNQIDINDFMAVYDLLGAQRHCKVLGIFTRLALRDHKQHYLKHIDRVERLLRTKLTSEQMPALRDWFFTHDLFD